MKIANLHRLLGEPEGGGELSRGLKLLPRRVAQPDGRIVDNHFRVPKPAAEPGPCLLWWLALGVIRGS